MSTLKRLVGIMLIAIAATLSVATPSNAQTVSFQRWDFTVWFSQSEARSISDSPIQGLTDAIGAGWACSLIKVPALAVTCTGGIVLYSWALQRTFARAADENKCVWLTFNYFGELESWGRYQC